MANYAVVRNGAVENIVVWDGETKFFVDGATLVVADSNARIGGTYDGAFHFVEPTPPEPTAAEVQTAADKTSGHDKLVALGLTADELTALGIV